MSALLEALKGPDGSLDAYLEIRSDTEIRDEILALMEPYQKTLRDEFAGLAMQALIAKSPFQAEPQTFEVHEKTALGAYEYADRMMEARK